MDFVTLIRSLASQLPHGTMSIHYFPVPSGHRDMYAVIDLVDRGTIADDCNRYQDEHPGHSRFSVHNSNLATMIVRVPGFYRPLVVKSFYRLDEFCSLL